MIVGLLPLDSRPCNYLWPLELARWSGNECLIPESGMDWFGTSASLASCKQFLLDAANKCDALVVSIDHLCFGSLLGSRENDVKLDEALKRLQILKEIHKEHPALRILGYNIIMRTSISSFTKSDIVTYKAMTKYSYYSDLADSSKNIEDRRKALEAKGKIPKAIIEKYETVRKRNLVISRECMKYAQSGVLSSLLLLQEDSEPYGFQKKDQRELLALKEKEGLNNVWLHNGADEGGVISVMKSIRKETAIGLEFLDGEQNLDFVARYEDRPFSENVQSYLSYAGISVEENNDWVLAIATPYKGIQFDGVDSPSYPEFLGKLYRSNPGLDADFSQWTTEMARRIKTLVDMGKKVYLLDVSCANGGNMFLMLKLASIMSLSGLAGYSGWNTATNSLGSILSQMISDQIAGKTNKKFLWERLLDDLVYQSSVRPDLNKWIKTKGWDEYCLSDSETKSVTKKVKELFNLFLDRETIFDNLPDFRASFPWNRTFEIDLRVDLNEKR